MQDIIDMAIKFKGKTFYDYHKAFATKAATIKQSTGMTIDWSVRDEKLYNTICIGKPINTCTQCGSSLHISEMCSVVQTQMPSLYPSKSSTQSRAAPFISKQNDNDKYGRPKLFYKDKQVTIS